jgi:hypothetical protein
MTVELKNKDISEKIIGASFEVNKFPGNGFQDASFATLKFDFFYPKYQLIKIYL